MTNNKYCFKNKYMNFNYHIDNTFSLKKNIDQILKS